MRRLTVVLWLLIGASIVARADSQSATTHAEVSGRVIGAGAEATPLARALVTISGPTLTPSRTVITDDEGRFAFRTLPPGRFTIVAARPPFVASAFGAKRPGRPGTPVELAAGQRKADISIRLVRGSAIAGMIRTSDGAPAVGLKVEVTPLDVQSSSIQLTALTDDRGMYRIFGLAPGKYLVKSDGADTTAGTLAQWSDDEIDQILERLQRRAAGVPSTSGAASTAASSGARTADPSSPRPGYGFAPMYFPGTADPDQAAILVLGEGEERGGIDIGLQFVRMAAIEGRVSNPTGVVPPGTQLTIKRLTVRGTAIDRLVASASVRMPDATGAFRFTGIAPGRYQVMARSLAAGPVVHWAVAEVMVDGDDVSGLELMLQPGLRLSGRVAFEARTLTPPDDLAAIQLRLIDPSGAAPSIPPGRTRPDGTFEIGGIVPGAYTVMSSLSDRGWWLRSAVVDGRDVMDSSLEFGATGDVTGMVVTFTDRRTELSGTLQGPSSVPAPDYFVVVFPRDRGLWRAGARRIQSTRPATDGTFVFKDLPPGDYFIGALTDLEPSDLADVGFLESLIPASVPIHLDEGEKKTQSLRIKSF